MYATKRPKGVKARYATSEELALLKPNHQRLTGKQIKFIQLLASGMGNKEAGQQCDLRSSGSQYRTLTNPLAIQYLSSLRAESRAIAAYDVAMAMQEAKEARDFAYEKGNAMAVVKATELRAKLSGLLIDRVEIATVDLTGALSRAEQRVSKQVTQAEPQADHELRSESTNSTTT